MAADPNAKQLHIKVGTVKRTKKEYEMYLKEETAQRGKIEAMKASGVDAADVKKQTEVLNDTLTVIPDTRQRLQKYHSELKAFLEEHYKGVEGHAGSGEPDEAGEALPHPSQKLVCEGRELLREAAATLGLHDDEEEEAAPAAAGDDASGGGDGGGTGGTGDDF